MRSEWGLLALAPRTDSSKDNSVCLSRCALIASCLTAKDASDMTLDMFSATFTTKGTAPSDRPEDPEGVEDVQRDDVQCTKVLRDGVLYILRADRIYTAQGQRVQ